jgi:hypothetical protein
MGGNPLLIIGVVTLIGVALNIARFMNFMGASSRNARSKVARITDMDAHLSFDERIAERMRELEREKHSAAVQPPASPPQSFGRRSV